MKKMEQKVFRNYDPNLHTQEKAVEYTRALTAAKLEKVNTFYQCTYFSCICKFNFQEYHVTMSLKGFVFASEHRKSIVSIVLSEFH